MRVVVDAAVRVGNTDQPQCFNGSFASLTPAGTLMEPDGLPDLAADGEHRIERSHRFLKNHRNPRAAHGAHFRLAHQPGEPSGCYRETDAVERTDLALRGEKGSPQILNFKQCIHAVTRLSFAAIASKDGLQSEASKLPNTGSQITGVSVTRFF